MWILKRNFENDHNHRIVNVDQALCYQNLFFDGKFNNKLWRSILDQIIFEIDIEKIGIQIISPFGFEILQDDRFLKSTLRRFYCYIGIPKEFSIDKEKIYFAFENKFFKLDNQVFALNP